MSDLNCDIDSMSDLLATQTKYKYFTHICAEYCTSHSYKNVTMAHSQIIKCTSKSTRTQVCCLREAKEKKMKRLGNLLCAQVQVKVLGNGS